MKQILISVSAILLTNVLPAQDIGNVRFEKLEVAPISMFSDSKLPVKSIVLSNEMRLEYVEQGDASGTPVIFLHGLGDTWRSYELVLKHLPAHIHAFAITQRGHGNAGKPMEGFTAPEFSNDLALFMKQLHIESAIIVGHSLGATVTQRFVLDHSEMTLGIVLIGSFATFKDKQFVNEFREFVNTFSDPIDAAFARDFQTSTVVKPVPAEFLEGVIDDVQKLPARAWKEIINTLSVSDYTGEFKNIQKPALLLWGDKDQMALLSDQEMLNSQITDSRLKIYKDRGHSLQWEEPLEVAKDIIDFVETLRKNAVHRVL